MPHLALSILKIVAIDQHSSLFRRQGKSLTASTPRRRGRRRGAWGWRSQRRTARGSRIRQCQRWQPCSWWTPRWTEKNM